MEIKALYDSYRPLLFTLAYQLTGTIQDAEDAVQDVFLKLHHVELERLTSPKAFLCKMVTNHCLDYLKSARKKREQYVGTWLPEPIRTSMEDISEKIIQNELLSYAMLAVMEQLTPAERAVFVLKNAYGFDYRTLATMIDKNEANCRKLYSRAKVKLHLHVGEMRESKADSKWMEDILLTLKQGNVEDLLPLLAADITVYSDGGGKVPAAIHPIRTPEMVLRFLAGLLKRLPLFGENTQIIIQSLNGQEAIIVQTEKNTILAALFEFKNNQIKTIYFVRNPEKLARLI